ncbi:hypothetical protein V1478_011950 [Vespula squamosa]|uniref:Uncharacterized protein n=1 Tax=Vespula squamosa TaxID=30214 RepID=A0ABD2ABU7_VESSQ
MRQILKGGRGDSWVSRGGGVFAIKIWRYVVPNDNGFRKFVCVAFAGCRMVLKSSSMATESVGGGGIWDG